MSVPITRAFGYSSATSIGQSPEPVPISTTFIVPESSIGSHRSNPAPERLAQRRSFVGEYECNTEYLGDAHARSHHLEAGKGHRHMHDS